MDVKQRITELMQCHGWSEYRLAKESGLSITISNMFNRNTLPSISTLQVICDSFGISLAQFFSEGTEVELSGREQQELFFKMALPYGRAKKSLYFSLLII
ncbi:MAG: helix-turn-helix domain-containing protein [Christensenellales bacterium]